MSYFDADDFFINDDECQQKTPLDEAKIKLLNYLKKIADEIIGNIEYEEVGDCIANYSILLKNVNLLTELMELNEDEYSDSEISEIIDKILVSSTEINYENMNSILKSLSESDDDCLEDTEDTDTDESDDGTDF